MWKNPARNWVRSIADKMFAVSAVICRSCEREKRDVVENSTKFRQLVLLYRCIYTVVPVGQFLFTRVRADAACQPSVLVSELFVWCGCPGGLTREWRQGSTGVRGDQGRGFAAMRLCVVDL